MSLCYNYQNGIINEKEDIIFATEPELFSIGTFSLPKIIQYVKIVDVEIMDIDEKTSILEQGFGIHSIKKKIVGNRYEPKVALEDKVYPKMYSKHQPGSVVANETPAKIKAQELQIVRWTLTKDQ